jgi:hypothetical protein
VQETHSSSSNSSDTGVLPEVAVSTASAAHTDPAAASNDFRPADGSSTVTAPTSICSSDADVIEGTDEAAAAAPAAVNCSSSPAEELAAAEDAAAAAAAADEAGAKPSQQEAAEVQQQLEQQQQQQSLQRQQQQQQEQQQQQQQRAIHVAPRSTAAAELPLACAFHLGKVGELVCHSTNFQSSASLWNPV